MINRRTLLGLLAASAVVPSQLSLANPSPTKKRRSIPWRNWSGSQVCQPSARLAPGTLDELQQAVSAASGTIRPVGAGHSFTPLVPTDGTIMSISRLSGVISHDDKLSQARIWAGTRLGDIGAPLAQRGQAMINMPDIDMQSLAGAMGTATHGTGATLGCIPKYVKGLQLLTANGELLECNADQNSDIFEAARMSLGALGIVTQVTLQNQPNYRLHRETTWADIDDILDNAESYADNNRNFEFFYLPFSGMGFFDRHNTTTEPVFQSETTDQNDAAHTLKELRDWLSWSPALRQVVMKTYMSTLEDEVKIAEAWQNYASPRNVRFNEMEYHLPRENGLTAFREVRKVLEKNFSDIFFPLECRYVAADDVWLSPFNNRESFSIAIHRYFDEDYKPYFDAIEPILKKYGGRPHWGKLNNMTQAEFQQHYPKWQDFKEIRAQLDPNGKFLNPYLQSILV